MSIMLGGGCELLGLFAGGSCILATSMKDYKNDDPSNAIKNVSANQADPGGLVPRRLSGCLSRGRGSTSSFFYFYFLNLSS